MFEFNVSHQRECMRTYHLWTSKSNVVGISNLVSTVFGALHAPPQRLVFQLNAKVQRRLGNDRFSSIQHSQSPLDLAPGYIAYTPAL